MDTPKVSVRIRKDQYDKVKEQAEAGHRPIARQLDLVLAAGLAAVVKSKG